MPCRAQVKPGWAPEVVLARLLQGTRLSQKFHVNATVLVPTPPPGEPGPTPPGPGPSADGHEGNGLHAPDVGPVAAGGDEGGPGAGMGGAGGGRALPLAPHMLGLKAILKHFLDFRWAPLPDPSLARPHPTPPSPLPTPPWPHAHPA